MPTDPAALPAAAPGALLAAFLRAEAQGLGSPLARFAKGEALWERLRAAPPAVPDWGRFLVALGTLAAEHLHDDAAASRYYLAALQGAAHHGDDESAVAAGLDLGVIQERAGKGAHARGAYKAAAQEGFRLGCVRPATLRAAQGAVRLWFAEQGHLDAAHAVLLKQSWLGWLWLREAEPAGLDDALVADLGRTLCAFLLPEDDPGELAARWRAWSPDHLAVRRAPGVPDGRIADHDPAVLRDLFAVAAEAADRHLVDEGADPGAPYRLLRAAAEHGAPRR